MGIGVLRLRDFWSSGLVYLWTSDVGTVGLLNFRAPQAWYLGTFGLLDFGTFGYGDLWSLGWLGLGNLRRSAYDFQFAPAAVAAIAVVIAVARVIFMDMLMSMIRMTILFLMLAITVICAY